MKKLRTGYTFDPHAGATYSFEHVPLADAEVRAQTAESPHIVEAINWTTTEGGGVHYNRYFAHDLDEALGLAVRLRIGFEEGVEEVVAIRPATQAEASAGGKASAHFLELMPLAISSLDHKESLSKGDEGARAAGRTAGREEDGMVKKMRGSLEGARGTAAKAIDRGAAAAGELGDRAAELANSAVEAAAEAAERISPAAGEVLKRAAKPVKRATKAVARVNKQLAAAEAKVAKKVLDVVVPGSGRSGQSRPGRMARKAAKKGGKRRGGKK